MTLWSSFLLESADLEDKIFEANQPEKSASVLPSASTGCLSLFLHPVMCSQVLGLIVQS